MTLVGLTDTVLGASRGTIMQMITPDKYRGRVMEVFQLSNRGLHPLGQVESGLVIPLIGVREATLFGGLLVTLVTLLIAWKVPAIPKFRWDDARYKAPRRKKINRWFQSFQKFQQFQISPNNWNPWNDWNLLERRRPAPITPAP